MSNNAEPQAIIQPPPVARHRPARPFLSPEISELLNMLEAFERSLVTDYR
jgi:hypothetical protein